MAWLQVQQLAGSSVATPAGRCGSGPHGPWGMLCEMGAVYDRWFIGREGAEQLFLHAVGRNGCTVSSTVCCAAGAVGHLPGLMRFWNGMGPRPQIQVAKA